MTRKLLLASACLWLAGCHYYATAVPSGYYKVGNSYRIELDQTWAKLDLGAPRDISATVFTLDGLLLNRVYLIDSLDNGKPLIKPDDAHKATPIFRADMTSTELAEFLSDSLVLQDYKNVETHSIRPQSFGGANGIRFDISAVNASGLIISGSAEMAIVNGKLDAIVYLAPQEYYHDLRKREVDGIFQSVALL